MYYTGKGDKGTSKLFNSKDRLLKSDLVFDVLGSLDELNSYLGLCAVEAGTKETKNIFEIIKEIQNNLFICQAHVAQSEILIPLDLLTKTEEKINKISQLIKPRNSFVISGGSRLSACLDIARTQARKTERRAVALENKANLKVDTSLIAYLNRLSSLLYVLARLANDICELEEEAPMY